MNKSIYTVSLFANLLGSYPEVKENYEELARMCLRQDLATKYNISTVSEDEIKVYWLEYPYTYNLVPDSFFSRLWHLMRRKPKSKIKNMSLCYAEANL